MSIVNIMAGVLMYKCVHVYTLEEMATYVPQFVVFSAVVTRQVVQQEEGRGSHQPAVRLPK